MAVTFPSFIKKRYADYDDYESALELDICELFGHWLRRTGQENCSVWQS